MSQVDLLPVSPSDPVRVRVAKLIVNRERLYQTGDDRSRKLLERQLTAEMRQAAADPRHWNDMTCWLIVLKVPWVKGPPLQSSVVRLESIDDTLSGHAGQIADLLPGNLVSWGYTIDSTEIADEGWIVTVSCNEGDANRLCALLHAEFNTEIRQRLLSVEKHFFGHWFRGMRTYPEAAQHLQHAGKA